jgi:asparagine synthase (glutamine-hydrolysing)
MKMSGLREKYILRKAAERYLPVALAARPKKPYRAPISRCLFGNGPIDYENEILSEKSLKRTGYFNPRQVSRLVEKCKRQNGLLFSERENMALIGIVTTELLAARFLTGFPGRLAAIPAPECILRYSPEGKQS